MLSKLASALLATLVLLKSIVWTVACCLPIYLLTLLKVLSPRWTWRQSLTGLITRITVVWARGLVFLLGVLLPTRWEIELPAGLRRDGSYLVIANHQSWVDTIVVLEALIGRIPFPRFFLKRQLLWLPFIGPVFWALDYPAMRRYRRDYLEKHPHKRGRDLETVRRATRRYRGRPVTIINFLEGTRFTTAKHAAQESPYRHLLRPRAGGVAFTVNAMEGDIRELVDLSIAYPHGIPSFWEFLGGSVPLVRVRVRREEVPPEYFGGDYAGDEEYRRACQEGLRRLWERKDRDLDELLRASF